jgi:hypothetical protein
LSPSSSPSSSAPSSSPSVSPSTNAPAPSTTTAHQYQQLISQETTMLSEAMESRIQLGLYLPF